MTTTSVWNEELVDFFKETLNIGVGNAATALEQLLGSNVSVAIPSVKLVSAVEAPLVLSEPGRDVVGVKMRVVGDLTGTIFFVLPGSAVEKIQQLIERAAPGVKNSHLSADLSAYAECANILAGVYLASINSFCKLNLFHSVPAVTRDMFQAVVDETLALLSRDAQRALLVVNEFVIEGLRTRTFLFMFFSKQAEEVLSQALASARQAYGA